ncbi:S-antigen protein [Liparis tanakae]|uniref:S-antigen protein n=1 Tax=Liparis tanakae TaxID=230148 RepID=A0A4Z2ENJ1_9TELE|nr:S-antigen protein [Liparis tanakae]
MAATRHVFLSQNKHGSLQPGPWWCRGYSSCPGVLELHSSSVSFILLHQRLLWVDLDPDLDPDLDQDLDPDLDLGVDLDLDQGVDLDLDQAVDLDLDQGVDLDLDQGVDLDLDQAVDLDLDQGVDLDLDQGVDLDLDQECQLIGRNHNPGPGSDRLDRSNSDRRQSNWQLQLTLKQSNFNSP